MSAATKWGVFLPSRTALMAGQSNAVNYSVVELSLINLTTFNPWYLSRVVDGGTSLPLDWSKGAALGLYDQMVDAILAGPAVGGKEVVIWWNQGETDCLNGQHNNYGAAMVQLAADLEADTGKVIHWLDCLISNDSAGGIEVNAPTVNAAKLAFAAADPTRRATINCDDIGFDDAAHWSAAGRAEVGQRMLTAAASLGLV